MANIDYERARAFADPYRRHDLRKNHKDLPEAGKRILFYAYESEEKIEAYSGTLYSHRDDLYFVNDDYEGYVTRNIYPIEHVLIWQYIEPFEEEI